MEESVSGFKERGGWSKVVEHGERLTHALNEFDVDEGAFAGWNEWRPKSRERLREDMNEKTAAQASIDEGEGERAGRDPDEDLKSAGEKFSESHEELDDPEEVMDLWAESIEYVARAADSAGRKAVRTVENTVYKNVMTQVAPYYFDNELVSANIQRTENVLEGESAGYVFEVDVNDDDLKERVSDCLAKYEDEVDRWHVDTEKRTEALEAVEGGETSEPDPNADPNTN